MLNKLHSEMIHLYAGDSKRIQHFCKVHSYVKLIAELEHVDQATQFILEAAALTHDIGIHLCEEKYGTCSGKLQENMCRDVWCSLTRMVVYFLKITCCFIYNVASLCDTTAE